MPLETNQQQFLESILFKTFGKNLPIEQFEVISGGNISSGVKIKTPDDIFYIKYHENSEIADFESEARDLELIKHTQTIATPEVFGYGKEAGISYLVLEFIPNDYEKPDFWEKFAENLACLHSHTHEKFGLNHDNFIGSIAQKNDFRTNGTDFYIQQRLRPQVGRAFYEGLIDKKTLEQFEKLYQKLPAFLPNEKPGLIHGNLCSENILIGKDGYAVVVDAAVSYSLRELEIAFTMLLGGFSENFRDVYESYFPLEDDFQERVGLYQLYPLLVYLNSFGKAYLSGIERILNRFVG